MTWRNDVPTQPNRTLGMICHCGHSLHKHGMSAPHICEECHCKKYRHSHDVADKYRLMTRCKIKETV